VARSLEEASREENPAAAGIERFFSFYNEQALVLL